MTTCPSGVNYMHLVDHARAHIEKTYRRPLADRLLRRLLALVLPRPALFRLALQGARFAKPLAGCCPSASPRWSPWRRRRCRRLAEQPTRDPPGARRAPPARRAAHRLRADGS